MFVEVKFTFLNSNKSPVKLMLTETSSWPEIHRLLRYKFREPRSLKLVTKDNIPVEFDPNNLENKYYVTLHNFFTPTGETSLHAYVYRGTTKDINQGDVVRIINSDTLYKVHSGIGGYRDDPSVKLESVSGTEFVNCKVSQIRLVPQTKL